MVMARALELANHYPNTRPSVLNSPPSFSSSSTSTSPLPPSMADKDTHQLNFQHPQLHLNQISFDGVVIPSSSSSSSVNPAGNFLGREAGSAYDMGELDHALFLYLDSQAAASDHHHQPHGPHPSSDQSSAMRPPTLNIFPSQPMHAVDPTIKASSVAGISQPNTPFTSKRVSDDPSMELSADPKSDVAPAPSNPSKAIKRQGNRKGLTSSSDQEGPKTPDPKTLRRLAQNREAARKSRLRKKAYVQQLESSRIRLNQLEQELQRARAQGIFFGGGEQGVADGVPNISPDAALFDLEYARWLEEHHRIACELRAAVQENLPENELKMYVDQYVGHHDVIMSLKSQIAKSDVFHLLSGMWMSVAERCFMWIGGFKPTEIIKVVMQQIEPLAEQQLLVMCQFQQTTHENEEQLNHALESLNQSISETVASDALSYSPNMGNYMNQMALAMTKISSLEGIVRQADHLRYQTFHQLLNCLTIRQAARCFLGIAEYSHRLRALSSLWTARPRQE